VLSDPVRLSILDALCERHLASAAEIAGVNHASERTVQRHLVALVALGLVHEVDAESDGESPGRPATRFMLNPRARESVLALLEVLEDPLEPWPRRSPLPPPARGTEPG